MNTLFIFNEAPSRSEKAFHGLRLANVLAAREPVRIFLFADGVHLAHDATGEFDVAELKSALTVPVAACASCLDGRGIDAGRLPRNVTRASLNDAADWAAWADKILVY